VQGYIITGNKINEINESKLINKLLNKNSVLCVNTGNDFFFPRDLIRVSDRRCQIRPKFVKKSRFCALFVYVGSIAEQSFET
jgi:molybdopterin biosynthesis enzyme